MGLPTETLAGCWAVSEQAPLWVSVALYAAAHANPATGVADLPPGRLRADVAPLASAPAVSQAIRRAVAAGWLHPDSRSTRLRCARPAGGYAS